MTNFQRVDAISNTQVGIDFEVAAAQALSAAGISVRRRFRVPVGVSKEKKAHCFDFGSDEPPVLVECKCHRWTVGANAPSAKLTVWNEAMFYFAAAPSGFRRILFVLRDHSSRFNQTLAEYYIGRYAHMIPPGVEIWEYDETAKTVHIRIAAV